MDGVPPSSGMASAARLCLALRPTLDLRRLPALRAALLPPAAAAAAVCCPACIEAVSSPVPVESAYTWCRVVSPRPVAPGQQGNGGGQAIFRSVSVQEGFVGGSAHTPLVCYSCLAAIPSINCTRRIQLPFLCIHAR